MSANNLLSEYSQIFNSSLSKFMPDSNSEYAAVVKAAEYSLSAGGKRLRPALVFEFCKMFSGTYSAAVNAAVAVEMVHTYSLIHDDLPCMDNDDMRRGKPSCHIAFGEDIALLAGDGLLTLAFATLAKADSPAERIVAAIAVLADCCGINGMVGGQTMDLESENKSISMEKLVMLQQLKTGRLIEAAVRMGCIFGGASKEDTDTCAEYAKNIGLAFQIRDDILDDIGNQELLGKPIGSDKENAKNTFLSFMSVDEAEKLVELHTGLAKSALKKFGSKADDLCDLADYLAYRNN